MNKIWQLFLNLDSYIEDLESKKIKVKNIYTNDKNIN